MYSINSSNNKNDNQNLYIGIMCGTSLDGIDVVLTDITNKGIKVLKSYCHSLPETIRRDILAINQGQKTTLIEIGKLNRDLGILFGDSVLELLKLIKSENCNFRQDEIIAIGNHGITVYHMPNEGFTIQLGDNNRVAAMTNITVVGDFRSRDIALGGQGAPLVPAFHKFILSDSIENRIVLNLGGISNITILRNDGKSTLGFDCGPANILMDTWIQQIKNEPFDLDGKWAASGKVNEKLLDIMFNSTDYFIKPSPKSTGRELFNINWLNECLNKFNNEIQPQDVQATLLELTCKSIVNEIIKTNIKFDRLLVCGGGAKNSTILNRLSSLLNPLNIKLSLTDDFGAPTQDIEASAFAWLAYRTINNLPGNLKEVTGATDNTILGSIYLKNK